MGIRKWLRRKKVTLYMKSDKPSDAGERYAISKGHMVGLTGSILEINLWLLEAYKADGKREKYLETIYRVYNDAPQLAANRFRREANLVPMVHYSEELEHHISLFASGVVQLTEALAVDDMRDRATRSPKALRCTHIAWFGLYGADRRDQIANCFPKQVVVH